jgi:superfamily II DNA helicase RecQ
LVLADSLRDCLIKIEQDLADAKYQIVLLSPEMALHSEQVHTVFASNTFQRALIAINVDEAHTISLWGGDFRKDYKGLGRIRARLPKGVPATIVSATLRPNVKQDAMATLGFSVDPSNYADINIGNERANVFVGVRMMKFPVNSFKDLSMLIDPNESDPANIPKTIVYIDDVVDVTLAVIALNGWLHVSLREDGLIMPVHAWMPASYRSSAMHKFAVGEVRILICTEAAGMVNIIYAT